MNAHTKSSTKTADAYQPIACNFYDYLEADAALGNVSKIKYVDHNGVVETISGVIKDLHARHGEEFLLLDDGQVLRLDAILEFNGMTAGQTC